MITDNLAEGAVDQNTQLSRLSANNTMSRQFSSNDRMLRYRRIDSTFFTDTMFANPNSKSLLQNKCCQVFVSDKGYVAVYLMKTQEEFPTRNIDQESAFYWWVPYTLRRRDRIIDSVNTRLQKTSHKYGVEIPQSVSQAYDIDERNWNTHWRDAINHEMENLDVAFDILPEGSSPPPDYRKASGHIIFDVRMKLERKS